MDNGPLPNDIGCALLVLLKLNVCCALNGCVMLLLLSEGVCTCDVPPSTFEIVLLLLLPLLKFFVDCALLLPILNEDGIVVLLLSKVDDGNCVAVVLVVVLVPVVPVGLVNELAVDIGWAAVDFHC